jgi:hypothetical protein
MGTTATRTDWLDTCEQIIHAFMVEFPTEWNYFIRSMKDLRTTRADAEFGTTSETRAWHGDRGSTRWAASFPTSATGDSLFDTLRHFYPELLSSDRKWRAFLRRFPYFRMAEKQ